MSLYTLIMVSRQNLLYRRSSLLIGILLRYLNLRYVIATVVISRKTIQNGGAAAEQYTWETKPTHLIRKRTNYLLRVNPTLKKEAANEKEWGYPVDGLIADIIGGHPRPSY